jgi:hypothetical protein
LLFVFENQIRAIAGRIAVVEDLRQLFWQAIVVPRFSVAAGGVRRILRGGHRVRQPRDTGLCWQRATWRRCSRSSGPARHYGRGKR